MVGPNMPCHPLHGDASHAMHVAAGGTVSLTVFAEQYCCTCSNIVQYSALQQTTYEMDPQIVWTLYEALLMHKNRLF